MNEHEEKISPTFIVSWGVHNVDFDKTSELISTSVEKQPLVLLRDDALVQRALLSALIELQNFKRCPATLKQVFEMLPKKMQKSLQSYSTALSRLRAVRNTLNFLGQSIYDLKINEKRVGHSFGPTQLSLVRRVITEDPEE